VTVTRTSERSTWPCRAPPFEPASSGGAFLTQDPLGLAGGVNLYAYAGNNPIAFKDAFGLCPEYLTGRPCLNPLRGTSSPPSLRSDGNGSFGSPRSGAGGAARTHRGNDLDAPLGSSVGAADRGVVIRIGSDSVSGNYVILGHKNAEGKVVSYTAYMHLGEVSDDLKVKGSVDAGQEIGKSGDTGNAKGEPAHLHFEIRTSRYGGQIDPAPELGIEE
jgi:murein DD-endopeptidase MepM/ murein hydrolase activator NlpD